MGRNENKVTCYECAKCKCGKDCPEFKKVAEFKQVGLDVYIHNTRSSDVQLQSDHATAGAPNTVTKKDIFILHNTSNANIKSADFVSAFDINNIKCLRCQYLAKHIQKLLQGVQVVDKKAIRGVCQHCMTKLQSRRPCYECQEIAKRFAGSSNLKQRLFKFIDKKQKLDEIGVTKGLKQNHDKYPIIDRTPKLDKTVSTLDEKRDRDKLVGASKKQDLDKLLLDEITPSTGDKQDFGTGIGHDVREIAIDNAYKRTFGKFIPGRGLTKDDDAVDTSIDKKHVDRFASRPGIRQDLDDLVTDINKTQLDRFTLGTGIRQGLDELATGIYKKQYLNRFVIGTKQDFSEFVASVGMQTDRDEFAARTGTKKYIDTGKLRFATSMYDWPTKEKQPKTITTRIWSEVDLSREVVRLSTMRPERDVEPLFLPRKKRKSFTRDIFDTLSVREEPVVLVSKKTSPRKLAKLPDTEYQYQQVYKTDEFSLRNISKRRSSVHKHKPDAVKFKSVPDYYPSETLQLIVKPKLKVPFVSKSLSSEVSDRRLLATKSVVHKHIDLKRKERKLSFMESKATLKKPKLLRDTEDLGEKSSFQDKTFPGISTLGRKSVRALASKKSSIGAKRLSLPHPVAVKSVFKYEFYKKSRRNLARQVSSTELLEDIKGKLPRKMREKVKPRESLGGKKEKEILSKEEEVKLMFEKALEEEKKRKKEKKEGDEIGDERRDEFQRIQQEELNLKRQEQQKRINKIKVEQQEKVKKEKHKEDQLEKAKLLERQKEEKARQDKFKEQKIKEDIIMGDKLKEDNEKEDKVKEDKIKEDKTKEDKIIADKIKEDKMKEEGVIEKKEYGTQVDRDEEDIETDQREREEQQRLMKEYLEKQKKLQEEQKQKELLQLQKVLEKQEAEKQKALLEARRQKEKEEMLQKQRDKAAKLEAAIEMENKKKEVNITLPKETKPKKVKVIKEKEVYDLKALDEFLSKEAKEKVVELQLRKDEDEYTRQIRQQLHGKFQNIQSVTPMKLAYKSLTEMIKPGMINIEELRKASIVSKVDGDYVELPFKSIRLRTTSLDHLIHKLVSIKQGDGKKKEIDIPTAAAILSMIALQHIDHDHQKSSTCLICSHSDLELELQEVAKEMEELGEPDVIIGNEILPLDTASIPIIRMEDDEGIVPFVFKSVFKDDSSAREFIDDKMEEVKLSPKSAKSMKEEILPPKGIIRYALSDRTFIDKGWTMLPTEKVVRKMNVYRMRPARPEFDWFEHNKKKGFMRYDRGEKLAEFDDDGRGRWYYRNGRLALNYYNAEELNAQQRYVVHSSGEPDARGRSQPITILATFDYLGNGVVFDHSGKIRLKYNQTEGILLDRGIGPVTHWKWHSLNDPPELRQVMIDTKRKYKDPAIMEMDNDKEYIQSDQEDMLEIEFENYVKERSNTVKVNSFKPYQIKMKALKINKYFSLRVLDQTNIYLMYKDGSTNLKLNLGMILDHREVIDTNIDEVGDIATSNIVRFPAQTDSVAQLQLSIANAQKMDRVRTRREQWLRPQPAVASTDQLMAAASRPLRPPLQTSESGIPASCVCKRKAVTSNLYYNTRLV